MTFKEFMKEVGYDLMTTFWEDFSIADKYGIAGVKDTYRRAFNEWKDDYEYQLWLSRLNYEALPEFKKLDIAEQEYIESIRRIQIANSRYRFSLAYYVNHSRKPFNTI